MHLSTVDGHTTVTWLFTYIFPPSSRRDVILTVHSESIYIEEANIIIDVSSQRRMGGRYVSAYRPHATHRLE
jgi:hypothetical protein